MDNYGRKNVETNVDIYISKNRDTQPVHVQIKTKRKLKLNCMCLWKRRLTWF